MLFRGPKLLKSEMSRGNLCNTADFGGAPLSRQSLGVKKAQSVKYKTSRRVAYNAYISTACYCI